MHFHEESVGGYFFNQVTTTQTVEGGEPVVTSVSELNNCSTNMMASAASSATSLLMSKRANEITNNDSATLGVSVAQSGVLAHVSNVARAVNGVLPLVGTAAVGIAVSVIGDYARDKLQTLPQMYHCKCSRGLLLQAFY